MASQSSSKHLEASRPSERLDGRTATATGILDTSLQGEQLDLKLLAGLGLSRKAVGLRRLLLRDADMAGVVAQLRGPAGAGWREVMSA